MTETKHCKLALFGDSGVGKSCLVAKIVSDNFDEFQEPTIGAAFSSYNLRITSEKNVHFEIWDTAGQERYRALAPMYYRNAHAALIVFDVTNRESFQRSKIWLTEVTQNSPDDCLIILVANKIDLGEDRRVTRKEIRDFCEPKNLLTVETSAMKGTNVKELFMEIGARFPERTDVPKRQERSCYLVPIEREGKRCCY